MSEANPSIRIKELKERIERYGTINLRYWINKKRIEALKKRKKRIEKRQHEAR